jgi:hypothetical protein
MDPRLLAVSAGDLRRVNIDPHAKARLTDRYAGAPSSPK